MHFYHAKSTLTSQFYIISHAEFDFHGFDPYFIEKTRTIKILKHLKNRKLYFFKQNSTWIAATKSNRLFKVKDIGFKPYFIAKNAKNQNFEKSEKSISLP